MTEQGIELENKRFCIFGIQGSGKTELAKRILSVYENSIVYDVLHEYQGFNRYLVDHRQVKNHNSADPAVAELDRFVNKIVLGSGLVRMFVIDEANRYCPNKYPLPASILDLNDFNRHDKITFGAICRRPAQLNTDLTELAHYLFVFSLVGRNDIQYLEDVSEGLGEVVRGLEPFCFVVVPPRRQDYFVHAPLDIPPDREKGTKEMTIKHLTK